MLKQRDSYIRKKFDKEEEWKQINEGQYVVTEINEEDLYKKMFPSKKELQEYYDYRKKWFEQGSKAEPGEKPLSINCELVSTCNLACTMCYTITSKFQNSVIGAQRMLPWKIVKSVIDECAKEKIPSISFSWRGESTLYRDHDENGKLITFPDVLQYARDKEIHEITCLTHGQLIDDDMAQKIVDAEPTWINFSIDGFKENYNKIRTPAKKQNTNYNAFQDVVDAIKRIVKYKKLKNKTRPVIRTNTIYPAVLNDFPKYKEFFFNLGVEYITVNEIYDVRHFKAPEKLIRKNWYCHYPFQRLTISSNGIILPCTGAVNEEKNLVVGKIKGSTDKVVRDTDGNIVETKIESFNLMEAWNSHKIKWIRELHKSNRRTEIEPGCKNCHIGQTQKGYSKIPKSWDTEKSKWKAHKAISSKERYRTRSIS